MQGIFCLDTGNYRPALGDSRNPNLYKPRAVIVILLSVGSKCLLLVSCNTRWDMVNPCYQYLPSVCWAKINSGAILLLSGEELDPLVSVFLAWFSKEKRLI